MHSFNGGASGEGLRLWEARWHVRDAPSRGMPMLRSIRATISALISVAMTASAGCSRGNLASQMVTTPSLAAAVEGPRCSVVPSQLRPLVVEWSGADRGSLELQMRRGLVVVRYEGCELELLRGCTAQASYGYAGYTIKHDAVTIRDSDDLFAHMPIGAARLEAKLARASELRVDMMLVGAYETARSSFARHELQGQCEAATHVLAAAQVGAFSLTSAGTAEVMGSRAGGEVINRDGDLSACAGATRGDAAAPAACGALLRLEFSPLVTRVTTTLPPEPSSIIIREGRRSTPPRDWLALPEPKRRQPVASPVIVGASLLGVGLAGFGMAAGGEVRSRKLDHQARMLDPMDAEDAEDAERRAGLGERSLRANTVALVGYGVGCLFTLVGVVGIAIGAAKMKRDAAREDQLSRLRVAPSVGRTYGGLEVTLRF